MHENYGGTDTVPANATTDWLDRFHRERRPRRSMRYYAENCQSILGATVTPAPVCEPDVQAYPTDPGMEPKMNGTVVAQDRNRDKLLSGMFNPSRSIAVEDGRKIPDVPLVVPRPDERSVPLTLVLSSLYVLLMHACFMASSWWLVHSFCELGNSGQASVTLFLTQLSSLPLFIVGVCRLFGRETWPTCALLLICHVLVAGFFNMVPLLQ